MTLEPARVPTSNTLRDIGPINWVICRIGARRIHAPQFHLLNVLSRHSVLLWAYLPFAGSVLFWGRIPARDTELVILRVGHVRGCEYELQQHRRLASTRGLDAATQALIFEGPTADGLTERQRALLTATDEFLLGRRVSQETWDRLATHLTTKQLIEFCYLVGHYDMVAATISTLEVPLDFPD
jgi:AhpD family alkylhydroperoxidase